MDATSGQSEVCKNIEDCNLFSSFRLHSCLRFSKIIPKYCWLWWYLVGEELNQIYQILFNVENLLSMLLKSLTGPHLLLCLQVLEVGEECEHLRGRCEQPKRVKINMVWAEDTTVNRHNRVNKLNNRVNKFNNRVWFLLSTSLFYFLDTLYLLDKHGDASGLQLPTDPLPLPLQQEPLSLAQTKRVRVVLGCYISSNTLKLPVSLFRCALHFKLSVSQWLTHTFSDFQLIKLLLLLFCYKTSNARNGSNASVHHLYHLHCSHFLHCLYYLW